MALQIRRGTEAQRAALAGVDVPAIGELLYTTDTKKIYVGDGVTGGGQEAGYFSSIVIPGQDTLLSSGTTGALTFIEGDGITLTTDDTLNTVTVNGFNGGTIPNLTIGEAWDASPTVASVDFEGDSNRLVRMVGNVSGYGSDVGVDIDFAAYRSSPVNNNGGPRLVFRQSTLLSPSMPMATIQSFATNVGFGQEAGKLVFTIEGATGTVEIDTTGFVGNLTGDVTGDVTGNVYATDTTLLVDAANGILTGELVGSLTGDVKGSVFADDSTVLVDGPAGVLRGELVGSLTGDVTTSRLNISTNTITTTAAGDTMVLNAPLGGDIRVESPMQATRLIASLNVDETGIVVLNSSATNSSLVTLSAFDGVGAGSPVSFTSITAPVTGSTVNYIRARGNPIAQEIVQTNDYISVINFAGFDGSGYIDAAQMRASVFGTPSTGIVPGKFEFAVADATGTMDTKLSIAPTSISANTLFRLVNLTSAERDALTPSYGDIIYNTTTNTFQGWQNTGGSLSEWVNLS